MSRHLIRSGFLGALLLFRGIAASAASSRGASLDVLVDGRERPEYCARGAVYIEAVRGRDYALRLTNPFPVRVAVALAVDGLNSIDAKHSDARGAMKWVLEPYGSLVVPGWQVSGSTARHFVFTGERSSYGAKLGQTEDLGVIEAVFFRERIAPLRVQPMAVPPSAGSDGPVEGGVPAPAPGSAARDSAQPQEKSQSALADELAATGMGNRTRHDVEDVYLELEPMPAARIRIRYEFRPELVALGIFPSLPPGIEKRERASGFSGTYCPEP